MYSGVQDDVKNEQDVLVCLAHLVLVSNGFKCIGLGLSRVMDGSNRKETLPKGWNECYAIRYVYQKRLYIFKATSLDGGVMLNLESAEEEIPSLVQLKTRSVVKMSGPLEEMVPNYKDIVDVVRKQLFEKVVGFRRFKDMANQTEEVPRKGPLFDLLKGPSLKPLGADVKVLYNEHTTKLTF